LVWVPLFFPVWLFFKEKNRTEPKMITPTYTTKILENSLFFDFV
jgi:hypothetical protein